MKDIQPLVSVIMNCFNSDLYLREAIESVIFQKYKNWELILWDNCSTDNTSKVIHSFDDERIKYFFSEKKTSLGKARNSALKKSSGQYFAFLDSDDIWNPDRLLISINFLRKNPNYICSYSNFQFIDEHGKIIKTGHLFPQPQGYVYKKFLRKCPVNLQTLTISANAFDNLDMAFDENFSLSKEYEMLMRVLIKNKIGYINQILAQYRIHQEMNSKKNINNYIIETKLFLHKHKKIFKDDPSYKRHFDYFACKIFYYEARSQIRENNFSKARSSLSKVKFKSIKFFGLYLLSLTNTKIWNFINNLFKKLY